MVVGGPIQSPWTYSTSDDPARPRLTISVPFNNATRAILNGTAVHRDAGCPFSTVVFANPSDQLLRKPLPAAPVGDTTLTANQVRNATGFQTIEDLLAAGQVTAE
jgi:hypothetical protein